MGRAQSKRARTHLTTALFACRQLKDPKPKPDEPVTLYTTHHHFVPSRPDLQAAPMKKLGT